NQYFYEPKLADAIVMQAQAQSNLRVIIVVSTGTDDPVSDPGIKGQYLRHCHALRLEFFEKLRKGLSPDRWQGYTMYPLKGIVKSKLILVDDRALSICSANANPRGFFLDTELNVMLDDAETVKRFRHRLWSHNLDKPESTVAAWTVPNFISEWDTVAK